MDRISSGDFGQPLQTSRNKEENIDSNQTAFLNQTNQQPNRQHKSSRRKYAHPDIEDAYYEASKTRIKPEKPIPPTGSKSSTRPKSDRSNKVNLDNQGADNYADSSFIKGSKPLTPINKTKLSGYTHTASKNNGTTEMTANASRHQSTKIAICLILSALLGGGVGTGIGYVIVSMLSEEKATETLPVDITVSSRVNETTSSVVLLNTGVQTSGRSTDSSDNTGVTLPSFNFPEDCGKRGRRSIEDKRIGRIVGGAETNISEYPWQASMWVNSQHTCGGSIIASNWILSAAHCTAPYPIPSSWTIYVGGTEQSTIATVGLSAAVSNIVTHENFDEDTYENDIALLRLSIQLTYTSSIQPICLPSINYELETNESCSISGWGALQEGGKTAPTLYDTEVDVFERNLCNSDDWLSGMVYSNMICAGAADGSKDACQGDSGGPMSCYDSRDTQFYLVGVVSWGVGCGEPFAPGVYTNVSQYLDWIGQKISEVENSLVTS